MKSKVSYHEESSIGLIILAIALIFEEDLVKYELVDTRCVISKFLPLTEHLLSNDRKPYVCRILIRLHLNEHKRIKIYIKSVGRN